MRIRLGHSYTGAEIAHILSVPDVRRDVQISHLTTDSREVLRGDLFVCLRGERYDGHRYIPEARARGAALILSEEASEDTLTVKDTYAALAVLAVNARKRVRPFSMLGIEKIGNLCYNVIIIAVIEI